LDHNVLSSFKQEHVTLVACRPRNSLQCLALFLTVALLLESVLRFGLYMDTNLPMMSKSFVNWATIDDLCEVAADAATTPCAHPSNKKKEDLECTFESNSTPSITEQQDNIDTCLEHRQVTKRELHPVHVHHQFE